MQLDLKYQKGVDYSAGAFNREYELEQNIYPVSFQPEFFSSEGVLYATGRNVVLMAHPEHGNITFYLRSQLQTWILDQPEYRDEYPGYSVSRLAYNYSIEELIITWCGQQIDAERH